MLVGKHICCIMTFKIRMKCRTIMTVAFPEPATDRNDVAPHKHVRMCPLEQCASKAGVITSSGKMKKGAVRAACMPAKAQ